MEPDEIRRISRATTTSLGAFDDSDQDAIDNVNDTTPQFSHKIVVAIDFGTTYRYFHIQRYNKFIHTSFIALFTICCYKNYIYVFSISGYAYSFTQEPENIHIMRKWEGDDPGINNQKTPTILLLTPNKVS